MHVVHVNPLSKQGDSEMLRLSMMAARAAWGLSAALGVPIIDATTRLRDALLNRVLPPRFV